MIKWIILAIFILSALYIQQRGKVRHSFYRQFFDHSTITCADKLPHVHVFKGTESAIYRYTAFSRLKKCWMKTGK